MLQPAANWITIQSTILPWISSRKASVTNQCPTNSIPLHIFSSRRERLLCLFVKDIQLAKLQLKELVLVSGTCMRVWPCTMSY